MAISNIIKYHYNTLKAANELGIANDYTFYLQLKSYNSYGFIADNKELLESLREYLNISYRHLLRKLKSCSNAKLISYKQKIGYQLKSYTKVWTLLGQEVSTVNRCLRRFNYVNLDIEKVLHSPSLMRSTISVLETRRTISKMVYKEKSIELAELVNEVKILLKDTSIDKTKLIREYTSKSDDIIADLSRINQWRKISLENVAEKIGMSKRTAWRYKRNASNHGMIRVFNRHEIFWNERNEPRFFCTQYKPIDEKMNLNHERKVFYKQSVDKCLVDWYHKRVANTKKWQIRQHIFGLKHSCSRINFRGC